LDARPCNLSAWGSRSPENEEQPAPNHQYFCFVQLALVIFRSKQADLRVMHGDQRFGASEIFARLTRDLDPVPGHANQNLFTTGPCLENRRSSPRESCAVIVHFWASRKDVCARMPSTMKSTATLPAFSKLSVAVTCWPCSKAF
jgi:hypothetical protein